MMVVVVVVVVVVAAVARLRWLWRLFNVPGADEPAPDASYDLHMFDDDYAYDHSDDSYSCHDDDYDSSYSCFNFYTTTSSSCNYSYSCFNFYTATTASAAAGIPARVALAAAADVLAAASSSLKPSRSFRERMPRTRLCASTTARCRSPSVTKSA